MLKIESGIPYTETRRSNTSLLAASMQACEIGQSFVVPANIAGYPATRMFVSRYQRKMGAKFAVRRDGDDCRVWRLA